jgi:hypothetical protein
VIVIVLVSVLKAELGVNEMVSAALAACASTTVIAGTSNVPTATVTNVRLPLIAMSSHLASESQPSRPQHVAQN